MQDHEYGKEQDPVSRSGDEETRAYGTGDGRTPDDGNSPPEAPGHGAAGQEPPPYSTSQEPPPYGTNQEPPPYGTNQEPPPYGTSQEPPPYGTPAQGPAAPEAGETLSYRMSSPPPGYGTPGGAGEPGHGEASQQTDAFWMGNQQPPEYGPGSQEPPPYPASWQPPGAGNWPPPGSAYGQWGPPPQPPNRRGRRVLAFALVAVLGVGIGAAAAFGITNSTNNSSPSASSPGASAVPQPGSQRAPLQNTGTSKINVPAISNAVSPSVANITSKLTYTNETAEGTGIVLNSSGLVLTNNHVINGATRVTAQIDGQGPNYTARVVGTDKTDDVALLQLQGASGLKAASVGDSSKAAVGDAVVALGNQGGQGGTPTATSGAITNTNRTITAGDQGSSDTETLHGMLQTDAYIAAGDSGGPLVNAAGQVIGMDTAAASNSGFGQSSNSAGGNIGFAIPINKALTIAREIAAGHSSPTIQVGERGFLGVGVADISTGCGGGLGNFGPGSGGSSAPVDSGALVCNVYNGTPAASAGVQAGDVITAVNGTTVTSAESLTKTMKPKRPGNQVSLTWVDSNGQQHTQTITLIAGPAA
jgi:S1-C subfamily serine protease